VEIEEHLLKRNRAHFGQAQGTPLTVYPLNQVINFEASTATTDLILDGRFTHEDLNDTTSLLIDHLQRVSVPAVNSRLTLSEFEGKIKSWTEKTSTSPSGVHLGHYKACFTPHIYPSKKTECATFDAKRQQILLAHVALINYAIDHSYSYTRWQKIVTMMIEKEKGNVKLHRLRVIHIYEADYNLLLCIKWRQVLHHASSHGTLNSSQYGGRPGHNAPDVVFVEEIEYEIIRATRSPLGKFDNDATSCYDRIHCFLANIASQKYGQSRQVCIVQGTTLTAAKYHLRTQMGVSKGFIQHSKPFPIYGTGQGSGNSPVYWVFIPSTLFDCHALKAHGALFSTPDGALSVNLYMLGFVDDTSNQTNHFESATPPSMEELIRLMQHDAQIWSDLLWASGGELELSKCTFHHIRFQFDLKGRPTMVQGKFSPHLHVRNNRGVEININQLANDECHKLLGCYKCPTGKLETQAKILLQKCNDFAKVVNSSSLSRHDSLIFYRHIYIPSVSYPLSSTAFTEKQMDAIQRRANRSLSQSCGYAKTTPFAIIHGPSEYGGSGFVNLMDTQTFLQIQQFVKHWRTPGEPGNMLRISMAWWQLVTGTSIPILSDPQQQLPHFDCESKYISSLRQALASIHASIELDHSYLPSLQREHDAYFMDLVLASGKFKPFKIPYINLCRLYLQIITVSDFARADGLALDLAIKQGTPSLLSSHARWIHCHQERPQCPHVWAAWHRACYIIAHQTGTLRQPLGRWLVRPHFLRRAWSAYFDPTCTQLYLPTAEGFARHLPVLGGFQLSSTTSVTNLPRPSIPIDIDYTDHVIAMNWNYSRLIPLPPVCTPTTWTSYLNALATWERPLVFGLKVLHPNALTQALAAPDSIPIACDGSAPNKASFGWIMSTQDGTRLASCHGLASGYNTTSYRAEGYGMLSPIRFLYHYTTFHHIVQATSPQLVCDNLGLVTNVNKALKYDDYYTNSTLASDWDVLREIVWNCQSQQLPPTISHIKGHQDKKKPYEDLPLLAQLNIDADALADLYMPFHLDQHRHVNLLPHAGCQLHLPSGTVTHHLKHELTVAKRGPPLMSLLTKRYSWDESITQNIDWKTHGLVLRSSPHPTTMIKFIHDMSPVGYRVNRYNNKYSPACLSCGHPSETMHHLHHCPSQSRARWQAQIQQRFRKTTSDRHTHPELQMVLLVGLQSTIEDHDPPSHLNHPPRFKSAIEDQNAIGWDQFLKGRWSKQWRLLHEQSHVTPTDSKILTKHWPPELLAGLWDSWYQMWEERNKDRHGHDAKTRAAAQRTQATREVELLYDWQPLLHEQHQYLFHEPLATLLDKATYQLLHWINLWKPIIDEAASE